MTSTTPSTTSSIVRTVALLALVVTGLITVALMFLWPLCMYRPLLLLAHIPLMIFCDTYLYIHRKVFYPIRYLLMPLIIEISKSESIQENTPTWYISTKDLPRSIICGGSGSGSDETGLAPSTCTTNNPTELLQSFPKRVRREIKRKLKKFEQRGITTSTKHCDYLSLYRDIPVLIDHERKHVRDTDQSFLVEFIKRFLVIFLTTSGYIDRYFVEEDHDDDDDDDSTNTSLQKEGRKPVALSLFVGQRNVLHSLMYFCKETEKESGIWFYQHFRMILRATTTRNVGFEKGEKEPDQATCSRSRDTCSTEEKRDIDIHNNELDSPLLPARTCTANEMNNEEDEIQLDYEYINFHVHQDFAKKCIGAKPVSCGDIMNAIYPFAFFHEPFEHIVHSSFNLEDVTHV